MLQKKKVNFNVKQYKPINIRNSLRQANDQQVFNCICELLKEQAIPSEFTGFATSLCVEFDKHKSWSKKQSLCARRIVTLNADKVCEIANRKRLDQ